MWGYGGIYSLKFETQIGVVLMTTHLNYTPATRDSVKLKTSQGTKRARCLTTDMIGMDYGVKLIECLF